MFQEVSVTRAEPSEGAVASGPRSSAPPLQQQAVCAGAMILQDVGHSMRWMPASVF